MRIFRIQQFRAIALVASLLLLPVGGIAQEQQAFVINLRNAEISIFAEQVSQITGRTLVLHPTLSGDVTILSSEPIDQDGVWALFQSILRSRGFTAINNDAVWQVVPISEARTKAPGNGEEASGTQDFVTRLLPLNSLPSGEAVRVLRPLIDANGYIEAVTNPNAIIISDTLSNVSRIIDIATSFDKGDETVSDIIQIKLADAATIHRSITQLLGSNETDLRMTVDANSNLLLVRGTLNDIQQIRMLSQALDVLPRPNQRETLNTIVYRLKFGDAETIAALLRSTLDGATDLTNPVAESIGRPENVDRAQALDTPVVPRPNATSPVAVEPTLAPVSIQASSETNSIIIRGNSRQVAEVTQLIKALDIRRPQVMIEAAIVEVSGDVAERLGAQLGYGDATPPGGIAATSFSNGGASLQSVLVALGKSNTAALSTGLSVGVANDDFGILIQALAQSTNANLLSTPSVTTMDNQAATIVVGQNVPFRTGRLTTDGGNVAEVIEREDVGITMDVKPRITQGGVVQLEIQQEVSSLTNSTVDGAADLITNRRVINTTVLADDGGTIVLGGLISDDRLSSRQKVPLLGDVPVLGNLFKSRQSNRNKRTLFVFLRPTILRTRADVQEASQKRFLRVRNAENERAPSSLVGQHKVRKLPLEIGGLY